MKHAELGASKAERWMHCPGSVALTRGLPEVESEYAREGTEAHAYANQWLQSGVEPDFPDEEMQDGVKMFVEEVLRRRMEGPCSYWLEHRFSLGALAEMAGLDAGSMFGTGDAVVFQPHRRRLIVHDLKYGRGVIVEAAGNEQGRFYALGALLLVELEHGHGLVDEVEVVIVQPRAYHSDGPIRREVLTYAELIDFGLELMERASATQEPGAPLFPGSWCKFCPAAGQCPALKEHSTSLVVAEFDSTPLVLPPDPRLLTLAQMGQVLDRADLVEDWLSAVRQAARTKLEAGEPVPGWKLVPKRAMRKWVDDYQAAQTLEGLGLDRDDMQETKLRSPAQIEKLLKPLKVELPGSLYTKESSGVTLAPSGDRREEVTTRDQIVAAFDAEPLALSAADVVEAEFTVEEPLKKRTSQRKGKK